MERPENSRPFEDEKVKDNDDEKTKISRRSFLKKTVMGIVGAGAAWLGVDKLQQVAHELTFDKEKMRGIARVIEEIKGIYPEVDQWSNASEWSSSILSACQKNNIPTSDENIAAILTIIISSSGFRDIPRSYDNLPTPSERTVAGITSIEPKTGGPMEVSYEEVAKKRNLTYEQAVNFVDTRDGGIEAGVEKLGRIMDYYSSLENEELRLKCIFADWNAGEGRSKIAGVQRYLNKVAGTNIAEDGIMGPQTVELIERYRGELEKTIVEPVPAALPVRGLTGVAKRVLTGVATSRDYADRRFADYLKIKKLISDYK